MGPRLGGVRGHSDHHTSGGVPALSVAGLGGAENTATHALPGHLVPRGGGDHHPCHHLHRMLLTSGPPATDHSENNNSTASEAPDWIYTRELIAIFGRGTDCFSRIGDDSWTAVSGRGVMFTVVRVSRSDGNSYCR